MSSNCAQHHSTEPRQPSDGTFTGVRSDSNRSAAGRFKFKPKSSKCHPDDESVSMSRSISNDPHARSHHHRRRRRRRRRHHRRLSISPQAPSNRLLDDPSYVMNSDAAFRESLFDAMGDDEGAAYWESIYGQPIHTYSAEKLNPESGELEKMSEEEYVAFVRKGMWERSYEGVEAEREQRRQERRAKKLREQNDQNRSRKRKDEAAPEVGAGATNFEMEVERSLRRGRERKEKKMWRDRWNAYEKAWHQLYCFARVGNDVTSETNDVPRCLQDEIVWPVESGSRKDINPSEIERFMRKTANALVAMEDTGGEPHRLLSNLKLERVRWHPDKVQHRFGTLNVDEPTLKGVTEVFQVMDQLYNDRK